MQNPLNTINGAIIAGFVLLVVLLIIIWLIAPALPM